MEITRFKDKGKTGTMVRVTTAEAMKLISSLAQQVLSSSSNAHREEFWPQGGKGLEYFSVAVQPTPIPERQYGPHEVQDFDYGALFSGGLQKKQPHSKKASKKTRRKR